MKRVRHAQRAGEAAIIMRAGTRLPEGCVLLSTVDIESAGFSLTLEDFVGDRVTPTW